MRTKLNRIVPVILSIALLLSLSVSAALPPSLEIQWDNTKSASCDIIVSGNLGTVSAHVTGMIGTTVWASARLFEIYNGELKLIYSETTPNPNPYLVASFTEDFTVRSGATYNLYMTTVITKNGVSETLEFSDSVVIP